MQSSSNNNNAGLNSLSAQFRNMNLNQDSLEQNYYWDENSYEAGVQPNSYSNLPLAMFQQSPQFNLTPQNPQSPRTPTFGGHVAREASRGSNDVDMSY